MITRTSDLDSSYLPVDIPKSYQYISTFLNNYKLETALLKPNRIKTSDYNLNLTKNKSIVKKNKLYLNKEAQLFSCVTTILPKISYVSDFKKRLISKAFNYARFMTILLVLFASYLPAQNEAYYIESLNENVFKGQTEVKIYGGRADIVNEEYAIEVEWADHWKNAIGQSLWYALQTNKKPGIVVLMKSISDRKYGIMLQSAIDYAGLTDKITVWFYPEDFGGDFESVQTFRSSYTQNLIEKNGNYTRNKNSGVRHKSTCAYFDCKNCVPCGPSDGKACGKCGG